MPWKWRQIQWFWRKCLIEDFLGNFFIIDKINVSARSVNDFSLHGSISNSNKFLDVFDDALFLFDRLCLLAIRIDLFFRWKTIDVLFQPHVHIVMNDGPHRGFQLPLGSGFLDDDFLLIEPSLAGFVSAAGRKESWESTV